MNKIQQVTYYSAKEIAHEAAMAENSPDHGVAVTVSIRNDQLYYIIWKSLWFKGITEHALLCSETSMERLRAHIKGFIQNLEGTK